jgi:hypothetical protein
MKKVSFLSLDEMEMGADFFFFAAAVFLLRSVLSITLLRKKNVLKSLKDFKTFKTKTRYLN